MKQASDGRTSTSKKKHLNAKPVEPEDKVIDRVAGVWLRFDRFGWDVLGVALLAVAVMTLLGLLGLTQGAFLSPWVSLLQRGLGWGASLVVLASSGWVNGFMAPFCRCPRHPVRTSSGTGRAGIYGPGLTCTMGAAVPSNELSLVMMAD
jgi:hypothetical protein